MSNKSYQSIEQLSSFASKYKTTLNKTFLKNLDIKPFGKYSMTEDSLSRFNHIVEFALNCVSKDTAGLDKGETDLSREFSRILLKYYDKSLDVNDVYLLLYIIMTYNKKVDELIQENPMVTIFGLDNEYKQKADYFNILVDVIYNKYSNRTDKDLNTRESIEYLVFKMLLNVLQIATDYTPSEKIEMQQIGEPTEINKTYYESTTKTNYIMYYKKGSDYHKINLAHLYDYYTLTRNSTIPSNSNEYIPNLITKKYVPTIVSSESSESYVCYYYNNKEYVRINNMFLTYNAEAIKINNTEVKSSDTLLSILGYDDIDALFNDIFKENDGEYKIKLSNNRPSDYVTAMTNKSKIRYSFNIPTSSNIGDTATIAEHNLVHNRALISSFNIINFPIPAEQAQLFDTTFGDEKLPNYQNLIDPEALRLRENDVNDDKYISFGVLYKELNPEYRKIMHSDIVDLAVGYLSDENLFINNGSTIVSPDIQTLLITYESTIQTFIKSLYANPYQSRRARESDIIRYFAGPLLTDSYGDRTNLIQRREVQSFLELYEETRDYYYARLLNRSFAFDKYYDAYEKYFLILYTIERFISYKIDTIHDIDLFDEDDIHNFLLTYGLETLDKSSAFYNSAEMKLKIIKNFISLIKNKGTSSVVDILLRIFNDENTEIKIGKYMLTDMSSGSAVTDGPSNKIKFVDGTEIDNDSSIFKPAVAKIENNRITKVRVTDNNVITTNIPIPSNITETDLSCTLDINNFNDVILSITQNEQEGDE